MAFDRAALTYDLDFTQVEIARWLRDRTWQRLDTLFLPGMRVLEIGCGTGEDALHLARRGVEVVATDASPQMLGITQQKTAGLPVTCLPLDLNNLIDAAIDGHFDGVYSNFGALNCTPHWSALAGWLADHMQTGGTAAFGVIGKFCLWETLWHGLHLDWRTASRRWSGQGKAVLVDGSALPVYYPAPSELMRYFEPAFQKTALLGLGFFLPPSDIFPVIEKRRWLLNRLTRLENVLGYRFPYGSDHYWLEMKFMEPL